MATFREEVNRRLNIINEQVVKLSQDRDILRTQLTEVKSANERVESCLNTIKSSKSKNYLSFYSRRLRDLEEGTITLSVDDYFQFWTDIHTKDEIYSFKVTSRILPCYWDEPEMQLYERRQIDDIERFSRYSKERQIEAYRCIDEQLSEALKKLKDQYATARLGNGLIRARFDRFMEDNFERIFVIDPRIPSDGVDKLVRTIKRQAGGGIATRLVSVTMNEKSTFRRPQDFGLTITSNGAVFGMFCDIDTEGNPQGGVIMKDRTKITHYLDSYLKLRGRSTLISRDCSEEELKAILVEIMSKAIDISDPEVYGNRCYACLKQAEDMSKGGKWKDEESPLRTFFEIYDGEQQALSKVLKNLDSLQSEPRSQDILELGCGPGRVINLILELVSKGKIHNPSRIVGYDQNSEIASYCTDAFVDKQNVIIHSHIVGFEKDGKFCSIRAPEKNSFDLIVAISNLVGWQDDREVEWLTNVIRDGLKREGKLFLTMYKRGFELERARMYKAAGDIIKLNSVADPNRGHIVIVVDAFGGEEHKSKAYTEDQLETILKEVQGRLRPANISIDWDDVYAGTYMWGRLLSVVREKA